MQWFNSGFDGTGSRDGCDGLGLSIWPRPGLSTQRGYQLFAPAATTRLALQRAAGRECVRPNRRPEVVKGATLLLEVARRRPLQGDEETLTFCSDTNAPHGEAASAQRQQQQKGRGRGRGQRKRLGSGPAQWCGIALRI